MITIHVLAAGDLFQHVLNAITAFMRQNSFYGLLRITALIGIIMAAVGFLKTRNPLSFAQWFVAYVLFTNLVLLPKTTVLIDDISSQTPKLVDNVPAVFALTASLITTIGYGLAQSYDALLSMPDDLQYTKTGSLFGARLITASHDFRIVNPGLREDMHNYFRSCVVGDIRLNHKYSVSDLANTANIWQLISQHASPLRMVAVNGKLVTCLEASHADGAYSLRHKLAAEIKQAYTFFGINLFGKPTRTTYEQLFSTHLTSAFAYYQGLTDTASNIFLQNMMINAINEGINHYQAFTDATAGIVSHQFSKSQTQHRWAWEIAGVKALWFLPLLHTLLTILLFGVFPIIIVLATIPGGTKIIYSYLQFFLSLQFWPVLFAILNSALTLYGSHKSCEYGAFTMVNIDKIDELHNDISGVAGYMMMLIPFLANGLMSNLGAAFNNLATSMTSHVQGSTMAVASEAANASFAIGQTSFYNTSANNFSANKHDSNWSHLHGMHTEQLSSGVLKTITGSGDTVFDVNPGMTKSALSIVDAKAMSASLTTAYETSQQAAYNESQHLQTSLSNFAHRAIQLSQLQGHDLREGHGISNSDSAQFTKAVATMVNVAKDFANREGVSTQDALTHLTNGGWGTHSGINSAHSIVGKLAKLGLGASGSANSHLKFDRASTTRNNAHSSFDNSASAREVSDFNDAFNVVQNFAKSHHFDDSHSQASQLSNQLGADLREAEVASHNRDASLNQAQRIAATKNYVDSNARHINMDLNQAFPAYVASRIGAQARDALFSQPGDLNALQQLQTLANDFIAAKRDELITATYATTHTQPVTAFYKQAAHSLQQEQEKLSTSYSKNSSDLSMQTKDLNLALDAKQTKILTQATNNAFDYVADKIITQNSMANEDLAKQENLVQDAKATIKYKATDGVIPFHAVDNTLEYLHIKEKKE